MKRCVIIGGAKIKNYEHIKSYLKNDDFYIFCDSGLLHKGFLSVSPDLIIGDFDSSEKPATTCEIIELPREKDDTDTFFAVKEAIKRGFSDFLLIGATGGRLDHSFGNLSILLMLSDKGFPAKIADDFGEMEICKDSPVLIPDSFSYFSVINIDGICRKVNIENAKYPLCDAEISPSFQFGISNEPLPGSVSKVTVGKGRALIIKIKNEGII